MTDAKTPLADTKDERAPAKNPALGGLARLDRISDIHSVGPESPSLGQLRDLNCDGMYCLVGDFYVLTVVFLDDGFRVDEADAKTADRLPCAVSLSRMRDPYSASWSAKEHSKARRVLCSLPRDLVLRAGQRVADVEWGKADIGLVLCGARIQTAESAPLLVQGTDPVHTLRIVLAAVSLAAVETLVELRQEPTDMCGRMLGWNVLNLAARHQDRTRLLVAAAKGSVLDSATKCGHEACGHEACRAELALLLERCGLVVDSPPAVRLRKGRRDAQVPDAKASVPTAVRIVPRLIKGTLAALEQLVRRARQPPWNRDDTAEYLVTATHPQFPAPPPASYWARVLRASGLVVWYSPHPEQARKRLGAAAPGCTHAIFVSLEQFADFLVTTFEGASLDFEPLRRACVAPPAPAPAPAPTPMLAQTLDQFGDSLVTRLQAASSSSPSSSQARGLALALPGNLEQARAVHLPVEQCACESVARTLARNIGVRHGGLGPFLQWAKEAQLPVHTVRPIGHLNRLGHNSVTFGSLDALCLAADPLSSHRVQTFLVAVEYREWLWIFTLWRPVGSSFAVAVVDLGASSCPDTVRSVQRTGVMHSQRQGGVECMAESIVLPPSDDGCSLPLDVLFSFIRLGPGACPGRSAALKCESDDWLLARMVVLVLPSAQARDARERDGALDLRAALAPSPRLQPDDSDDDDDGAAFAQAPGESKDAKRAIQLDATLRVPLAELAQFIDQLLPQVAAQARGDAGTTTPPPAPGLDLLDDDDVTDVKATPPAPQPSRCWGKEPDKKLAKGEDAFVVWEYRVRHGTAAGVAGHLYFVPESDKTVLMAGDRHPLLMLDSKHAGRLVHRAISEQLEASQRAEDESSGTSDSDSDSHSDGDQAAETKHQGPLVTLRRAAKTAPAPAPATGTVAPVAGAAAAAHRHLPMFAHTVQSIACTRPRSEATVALGSVFPPECRPALKNYKKAGRREARCRYAREFPPATRSPLLVLTHDFQHRIPVQVFKRLPSMDFSSRPSCRATTAADWSPLLKTLIDLKGKGSGSLTHLVLAVTIDCKTSHRSTCHYEMWHAATRCPWLLWQDPHPEHDQLRSRLVFGDLADLSRFLVESFPRLSHGATYASYELRALASHPLDRVSGLGLDCPGSEVTVFPAFPAFDSKLQLQHHHHPGGGLEPGVRLALQALTQTSEWGNFAQYQLRAVSHATFSTDRLYEALLCARPAANGRQRSLVVVRLGDAGAVAASAMVTVTHAAAHVSWRLTHSAGAPVAEPVTYWCVANSCLVKILATALSCQFAVFSVHRRASLLAAPARVLAPAPLPDPERPPSPLSLPPPQTAGEPAAAPLLQLPAVVLYPCYDAKAGKRAPRLAYLLQDVRAPETPGDPVDCTFVFLGQLSGTRAAPACLVSPGCDPVLVRAYSQFEVAASRWTRGSLLDDAKARLLSLAPAKKPWPFAPSLSLPDGTRCCLRAGCAASTVDRALAHRTIDRARLWAQFPLASALLRRAARDEGKDQLVVDAMVQQRAAERKVASEQAALARAKAEELERQRKLLNSSVRGASPAVEPAAPDGGCAMCQHRGRRKDKRQGPTGLVSVACAAGCSATYHYRCIKSYWKRFQQDEAVVECFAPGANDACKARVVRMAKVNDEAEPEPDVETESKSTAPVVTPPVPAPVPVPVQRATLRPRMTAPPARPATASVIEVVSNRPKGKSRKPRAVAVAGPRESHQSPAEASDKKAARSLGKGRRRRTDRRPIAGPTKVPEAQPAPLDSNGQLGPGHFATWPTPLHPGFLDQLASPPSEEQRRSEFPAPRSLVDQAMCLPSDLDLDRFVGEGARITTVAQLAAALFGLVAAASPYHSQYRIRDMAKFGQWVLTDGVHCTGSEAHTIELAREIVRSEAGPSASWMGKLRALV